MSPTVETGVAVQDLDLLRGESGAKTDPEHWDLICRLETEPMVKHRLIFSAITSPKTRQEEMEDEGLLFPNSTELTGKFEGIERTIERLFESALEEIFEDGMESSFSKRLIYLVKSFGNTAIENIADLILNQKVNGEVAAEALRWLGRIKDPSSYAFRYWLVTKCLGSSLSRIRDGAILGLTSMGDPQAKDAIEKAIQNEKCEELREDMQELLDYLKHGRQCRLF